MNIAKIKNDMESVKGLISKELDRMQKERDGEDIPSKTDFTGNDSVNDPKILDELI
ncbi:hypothetical protein [Putridiphycobacter roseus]